MLRVPSKLIRVAKSAQRVCPCVGFIDAERTQVLDSHLDVHANFVIEILQKPIAICR
jgi:hypothetical protein